MSLSTLRILSDKRDGRELSAEQIKWLVDQHVAGEVADYQMAAFAMAVYINGMTPAETAAFTNAKLHSGRVMAWPSGVAVVDKHSTGGIGDKVSLLLAPMLAVCGLRVPMISGRGLGPTGGTLDKLEAIPGFRTDLSIEEIQRVVAEVGCCITGASDEIAPADKKMYALRDVTATVPSIPLITASIMSKKLSEGLDALVLDVKVGSGAFMKTLESARKLADSLIETGERLNVTTRAVLTDMNQPLGRMIGNAVEVDETIAALDGQGPADLMECTLALGEELLVATKLSPDFDAARKALNETITSGKAIERFEQMVRVQGGDLSAPRLRGKSSPILAPFAGYVTAIDAEALGWAVIELGGGRLVLTDKIDFSVGLEMLVRIGDRIDAGQPWMTLFESPHAERTNKAKRIIEAAITLGEAAVPALSVVIERRPE
jgi:pyrimidine-nucleoside phosphorylase